MKDPVLINLHVSCITAKISTIEELSLITEVGISFGTVFTLIARISDGTDTNEITNFD